MNQMIGSVWGGSFHVTPFSPRQNLSMEEQNFVVQLAVLPLLSILDGGKGGGTCRALGQKIFDGFKARAGGDSYAGRDALIRICDGLVGSFPDGALRRDCVELAWNRIGDTKWSWMARS